MRREAAQPRAANEPRLPLLYLPSLRSGSSSVFHGGTRRVEWSRASGPCVGLSEVRGAEVGGVGAGGAVGGAVVAGDGVGHPRGVGRGLLGLPGRLPVRGRRGAAPHRPGGGRRRVAPGGGRGQPLGERAGSSGAGESEGHRIRLRWTIERLVGSGSVLLPLLQRGRLRLGG
uniref:Uncharacterized protein n=1 Tax=Triticum urartu TaxID=4572 RepID=A0A8R7TTK4_TRIUA